MEEATEVIDKILHLKDNENTFSAAKKWFQLKKL